MIRRALISVSDKTGVVELARALTERGVEVLSTGGTAKALHAAGVAVTDVSSFTGFPEMLDGRVKTLHPKVHGGLLYLRGNPEHEAAAKAHGLQPIDMVVVNLYPFEATVARSGATLDEAIENIDIGGPAMLRSAAKNHRFVTVVTDPADYPRVLESLEQNGGDTDEALRRELAQKVYARTAQYDAAIATYLAGHVGGEASRPLVLAYAKGQTLRYGENPHQTAMFYRGPACREACIGQAEILHGKEMSYNNYLDGDAALEAAKEHAEAAAAVVIKHTNPCGCATGATLAEALETAWQGDVVSAFGSVIAVTRTVDRAAAEVLRDRFVEALIAPDFTPDALEWLRAKSRDLRLLRVKLPVAPPLKGRMVRHVNGGLLVQDRDAGAAEGWTIPTRAPFPESRRALAEFGIRVCKHIKSNAIAIVCEYAPGRFRLLGMGAGQPNRVDATRKLALTKATENLERWRAQVAPEEPSDAFIRRMLGESVLVSDAFFPFPDNVEAAAGAGIRFIVQPGGSKKDDDVIAACDRLGVALALTGVRHFRH